MSKDDGYRVHVHSACVLLQPLILMTFFSYKNNCNEILPILNNISTCVFSYDNASLLTPFTIEEFKNVLFQMNADKLPRPDG